MKKILKAIIGLIGLLFIVTIFIFICYGIGSLVPIKYLPLQTDKYYFSDYAFNGGMILGILFLIFMILRWILLPMIGNLGISFYDEVIKPILNAHKNEES